MAQDTLFILLLDDSAGEDEEFLSCFFPPESQELRGILPMKGVFLAACGIVRAALGEDVSVLTFRNAESGAHYRASLCRIERWVLCVLLPAEASDHAARFLAEEVLALVALRHGRLGAVQDFSQLDPLFRSLARLWRTVEDGGSRAVELYASLGVVLLSSAWQEVRDRISDWEGRWAAGCGTPLARPSGFALFLGQSLLVTSLSDKAFEACLRLCHLDGSGYAHEDGPMEMCDVRCHSLFLDDCDSALPSHQYSVLQQGAWSLFMLWKMAYGGETPSAASDARTAKTGNADQQSASDDPFGIDLCMDFMASLPQGKVPAASPQPRASSPGRRRRSKVALPSCLSWRQKRKTPMRSSISALEHGEGDAAQGLWCTRTPAQAARERHGLLRCPEGRCRGLASGPPPLGEWSALERLLNSHVLRRFRWCRAPLPEQRRHPLLALRLPLEALWAECQGVDVHGPRALGGGDPWRFQAGAPFLLSDVSPVLGLGSPDRALAVPKGTLGARAVLQLEPRAR